MDIRVNISGNVNFFVPVLSGSPDEARRLLRYYEKELEGSETDEAAALLDFLQDFLEECQEEQDKGKYKGGKPCSTPHVTEEQVKDAFVRAVNILLSEKDELAANVRAVIAVLCGSAELEKRQSELKEELEVVVGLVERCVAENARTALDQDEYSERYNGLVSRYEAIKAQFDEVTQAIADKADRKKLLEQFLQAVETQEPVTEFDERLWSSLMDFMTVYSEKDIRVTFKDGTEIPIYAVPA